MKLKRWLTAILLVVTTVVFSSGCYMISAQRMWRVKGTYKLTTYSRTHKETGGTYDYLTEQGQEVYLVITGEGRGYYVYKDNETQAYSKVVDLRYEYSEEESSKISRVGYKDSTEKEYTYHGVTRNSLNYSNPGIWQDYEYSRRWTKVSRKTDLSKVKEELGEIKEYSYEAWGANALYEVIRTSSAETGDKWHLIPSFEYQYYFIAIDSLAMKATTYYALKSDLIPVVKTETITFVNPGLYGGWAAIKIGDVEWGEPESGYKYERKMTSTVENTDGADVKVKYIEALHPIAYQWTEELIQQRIADKMPMQVN